MEIHRRNPQEVELAHNRKRLAKMLKKQNGNEIPNVFSDIEIIERTEGSIYEDCGEYVFGIGKLSYFDEYDRVMRTSTEVTEIKEDDIILYFDRVGNRTHVGRGTLDGKVVSKWGLAHVFKHPARLVPSYYGEPKIYRPTEGC